MSQNCIFSPDRTHRYTLWRYLDGFTQTRFVQFIGLNPSTADEIIDDPTIRRCKDFAARWGYSALCMTNLFSFRATDPKVMRAATVQVDHIRLNRWWIKEIACLASLTVCAWGVHGSFRGEADALLLELSAWRARLHCLGRTKDGHPKHPLYLRADSQPIPFP